MSHGPLDIDVDTLGNLRPISQVVLSLGSNVGDSPRTLKHAIEYLADTPGLIVVDVSPVYETKPVGGGPEQNDFLNLIVLAETTMEPMTVLDRTQAIETTLGRQRASRNGPRTLDIDIIVFGKRASEEALELPHPRAHERAFVLVPWLDVDPAAELPGQGPVADLVKEVDVTGVTRLDDVVIPIPERR